MYSEHRANWFEGRDLCRQLKGDLAAPIDLNMLNALTKAMLINRKGKYTF